MAILLSPFMLITTVFGVFLQLCRDITRETDDKFYRLATMTQVLEALCEDFPQLLLQIYILLADESIRSFADIETSQYVSMAASIILLSWSFTCYEKMMYYMINDEKMPICGEITVFVLKFCECFLRVLTFGMLVSLLHTPVSIVLVIVGILIGHIALLTVADFLRAFHESNLDTAKKGIGRFLYAAIQRVVCYTTINKISNSPFRIIFYYSVVLVETVIFVVLWFSLKPDRLDWIPTYAWVIIFCVIGILLIVFLCIYHYRKYHEYDGTEGPEELDTEYCQFMACPCCTEESD